MTDLQVVQPVFTLVLQTMFRLRATTLSAIVGRGVDVHACHANPSEEREDCSKQELRADESNDAV